MATMERAGHTVESLHDPHGPEFNRFVGHTAAEHHIGLKLLAFGAAFAAGAWVMKRIAAFFGPDPKPEAHHG